MSMGRGKRCFVAHKVLRDYSVEAVDTGAFDLLAFQIH